MVSGSCSRSGQPLHNVFLLKFKDFVGTHFRGTLSYDGKCCFKWSKWDIQGIF